MPRLRLLNVMLVAARKVATSKRPGPSGHDLQPYPVADAPVPEMRRPPPLLPGRGNGRRQVVGPKDPGIYYVATITSPTYEHDVEESEPRHFRWRTDIRFDYRVQPPLLRSELVADAELGSFRPFRGFEGSNVPVPPEIASVLAARVTSRLERLG